MPSLSTPPSQLAFLQRHVLNAWFPRCFDPHGPGLVADFDTDWTWLGAQPRLLEFSARQGWAACVLTLHCPEQLPLLEEAIRRAHHDLDHVFQYPGGQGWGQWAPPRGAVSGGAAMQLHGVAYLIAFAATFERTHPGQGGLQRGRQAWALLESASTQEPLALLRCPPPPADGTDPWTLEDGLGTPLALCDMNQLEDLFEALLLLHGVWPDSPLEPVLHRLRQQLLHQIHAPTGMVLEYFDVWGHPGPGHLTQVGRCWQLVKRLLLARKFFPLRESETARLATVVQALLRRAWDSPGWVYALPAHPPDQIQGQDLVVRTRSWWVQFEAVASLALAAGCHLFAPELRARAAEARQRTEAFILEHLVDHVHGGVFSAFPRTEPGGPQSRKGGPWKDASHETLCIHELLRQSALQVSG